MTGDSERTLSSYKGRTAVKLGIPVVPFDFITECIKSGKLVDPQPFALSKTLESQNFSSGKIVGKQGQTFLVLTHVDFMLLLTYQM